MEKTKEQLRKEIEERLNNIQFLSPNEPMTPQGIERVLEQMTQCTEDLAGFVQGSGKTITMWSQNVTYSIGDIVLYFKKEDKQVSPDVGKREFAFILASLKDNNTKTPHYDIVDGIPTFVESDWRLLNPLSYLLQDLVGMKKVVKEAFANLLQEHIEDEHGLVGSDDIAKNLVRKDYANLSTPWGVGKFALVKSQDNLDNGNVIRKIHTNGLMEYQVRYSFDEKANPYIYIDNKRHYLQKSPIWDESDQTIFSQKYSEDNMFSVNVHEVPGDAGNPTTYTSFNNLRYGTNIFHKRVVFPTPFANDGYMVFFDTYGREDFVFGYDKSDIEGKDEPTYDAIVSMPMLMNKTESGFDIVLPIHTYFNSIQKYNIGVPWNNVFTFQAVGRMA